MLHRRTLAGRPGKHLTSSHLSRHLLPGFLLADQTPSVRLVEAGGLPGSHAWNE